MGSADNKPRQDKLCSRDRHSLLTPVCLKPVNPSKLFSLGFDHRKKKSDLKEKKRKTFLYNKYPLKSPPPPLLIATNPEGTYQSCGEYPCYAHHTRWGHWVCKL